MDQEILEKCPVFQIIILGGGAWGKALRKLVTVNGHEAQIWTRHSLDLPKMLAHCDFLVSALPMAAVKDVAQQISKLSLNPKAILVSTTKGLDLQSGLTPAQIWNSYFPHQPLVVMSGPNLSQEIMAGLPSATVVAHQSFLYSEPVQALFSSPYFRVYTNDDPIGVELGGTLKNVIAIAVGVCDGLKLGDNAKAALVTRSLAEIIRIADHWGAKPETFWGLSGLGDLLATCNSPLSRNYRLGLALAQGQTLGEAIASIDSTIEGINTARALIQIADDHNIYLPVCRHVYQLLEGKITPTAAVAGLMSRDRKAE